MARNQDVVSKVVLSYIQSQLGGFGAVIFLDESSGKPLLQMLPRLDHVVTRIQD